MSAYSDNLIAIKGSEEAILKFMKDGMGTEDLKFDCDLFTDLTLRSWIPGEDSYPSNIKDLGVKYDATFTEWECVEEDENEIVICGHIETTPGFPLDWLIKVANLYPDLDFCYYSIGLCGIYSYDYTNQYVINDINFTCLSNNEKFDLANIIENQFYRYIAK